MNHSKRAAHFAERSVDQRSRTPKRFIAPPPTSALGGDIEIKPPSRSAHEDRARTSGRRRRAVQKAGQFVDIGLALVFQHTVVSLHRDGAKIGAGYNEPRLSRCRTAPLAIVDSEGSQNSAARVADGTRPARHQPQRQNIVTEFGPFGIARDVCDCHRRLEIRSGSTRAYFRPIATPSSAAEYSGDRLGADSGRRKPLRSTANTEQIISGSKASISRQRRSAVVSKELPVAIISRMMFWRVSTAGRSRKVSNS